MSQRFFGEPWPSGVCDDGEQVPTPVGQNCFDCAEPIVDGDRGTFIFTTFGYRATPLPVHRECQFREVMGGYGHHINHDLWCIEKHDPDGGLTRRESALMVWALAERGGLRP